MSDADKITIHISSDIKELVPRFLDSRQKEIAAIREALKKEDFKGIQNIGHTLKGAAAGYGFDYLSEIGKSVEMAAREKNNDCIEVNLTEIADYLERIEIVYDS